MQVPLVFVSILSFVSTVIGSPNRRAFSLADLLGADEIHKSKTESVIEERSEQGRMVLLICSKTCAKHRSEIPLWLKEFNHAKKYDNIETITYYYHTYKQPRSFVNGTKETKFPNLMYFIGNKKIVYNEDVNNKDMVLNWLTKIDQLNMIKPTTYDEINNIISSTSNCSTKYLLLAEKEECVQESMPIVARVVQEFGIQPVRLDFPMDKLMHVSVFRRLPLLNEESCHLAVLLYENSYSEFSSDINPIVISEWISSLLPVEYGSCPPLQKSIWHPIKDELTELEQIFFTAELEITERNHRVSFILVGLTSGLAVIVLAYSIFWGLNGSAFAK